jgi:sugar phosphate isomerase/epimerase
MIMGLSHQALFDYSTSHFIEIAKKYFDGIELVDEPVGPTWELETNLEEIKKTLADSNLYLTFHATYRDLNLASFVPQIQKLSIEQGIKSLEKASQIGAKVVTFHPGKMSGSKFNRLASLELLGESLNKILEVAEEHDIKIAIENQCDLSGKKLCQDIDELTNVLK